MNQSKSIRVSLQVFGLSTLCLLAYQNCAPGALNSTTSASTNASFSDCGGSVCEVTDMHTIAMANAQQVSQMMVAKAGVTPSAKTQSAFTSQLPKVTVSGDVSSITAPMWTALQTMGGEVCNDLVTQEKAMTSGRRIFSSVDFTKGPSSVTDAALNDAIRRLARSFWSRNESVQELGLIKSSLTSSFSGTAMNDTSNEMLYLCTAMIASTDAQKM